MGSAGPTHDVITWDYLFAPNAQKARSLLTTSGIPFKICEQPFMQPRPILQNLGITYRRVPLISIGKDVIIDNRAFIDAVAEVFPEKALPTTRHDHAYEAFGYRHFWIILASLPVAFLNDELIAERKDLFPVFGKKNYKELRPSAITELRGFCQMIENDFLSEATDDAPFIFGAKPGVADVHVAWIPMFSLNTLNYAKDEPGFDEASLPKLHRWLSKFSAPVPENEPEKIDKDVASKQLLDSQYALKDVGVDEKDPTGLKKGQKVYVQTSDDNAPENAQQHGTLVGLAPRRIVIELDNGIRLHFPRVGYAVLAAD